MLKFRQQDYQIPENVAYLLEPISKKSPTGEDASLDGEYFKLDMEIGKANPDYNVCMDLASEIIREKSKDLRIACWLCFAWYRKEKIIGLRDGLILLLEMLKKYGDRLFPVDPAHRSKALQFLNSARLVKLLEKEVLNKENAQLILELNMLFELLVSESKKQFPDHIPSFSSLAKVISSHAEAAQKISEKTTEKETPIDVDKTQKDISEKVSQKEVKQKEIPSLEIEKKLAADVAVGIGDLDISSGNDAIFAITKALRFFFQQENEDRMRHEPYIYGLSRTLIWSKLVIPPNTDFVTQIAAPDSAIQNIFHEWHSNQEWDKLIAASEINFLDEDTRFKYWITAQRYQSHALIQKGGGAERSAAEVNFHLARLIRRFPDFPKLKFANNMPFADEDTLKWIEDEIKTILGSQKQESGLLPPILGEDYEPIRKEYQEASDALPEDFEKNMAMMQQGIAGETRRKGRFLRLLNLANFCIQGKQYKLAKVYLSGLLEKIEDYQLMEWEPALCAAVWESTYLVNLKLLESEKDQGQISIIEKQQDNVFKELGNFDGVRALKLANRK